MIVGYICKFHSLSSLLCSVGKMIQFSACLRRLKWSPPGAKELRAELFHNKLENSKTFPVQLATLSGTRSLLFNRSIFVLLWGIANFMAHEEFFFSTSVTCQAVCHSSSFDQLCEVRGNLRIFLGVICSLSSVQCTPLPVPTLHPSDMPDCLEVLDHLKWMSFLGSSSSSPSPFLLFWPMSLMLEVHRCGQMSKMRVAGKNQGKQHFAAARAGCIAVLAILLFRSRVDLQIWSSSLLI